MTLCRKLGTILRTKMSSNCYMLDLGRDNVSMFCKSSFAPPSFLRTDQPNRAQPSSLLWSEDSVCSCCVCFVCTKHPHTQWRVNLCWYERQPGVYGFRRCKVRHEPTHPCFVLHISQRSLLYMLPRQFGGVSVVLPRKEHLTGLLVGYLILRSCFISSIL